MNRHAEIALSFSGGGFRAAMFHLGTLHYLHHLQYEDGSRFLDDVNTISTISGGSITGLWYMMHVCKDHDVKDCIKELYEILITFDLPSRAIDAITCDCIDRCSLIREMVELYDSMLFHGETFNTIQDKIDKQHVHHFSANGTDFSSGLAFRFQASRKILNAEPQYSRGVIGNNKHKLPWSIAGQIKLSEILAVSSCFPGGFEPMKFPADFAFSQKPMNADFVKESLPFDIMDGGIVDNQGIEPILLASAQMTYDNPEAQGDIKYPSHDIIIVSDVANAQLGEYNKFNIDLWKWLSLKKLNIIAVIFVLVPLVCGWLSYKYQCPIGFGASLATFIIFSIVGFLLCWLESKLFSFIKKTAPFEVKKGAIKRLKFYKVGRLAESRLNSLLRLAQTVFMKPIRQMRYNALYQNDRWKNRCISNNIGELSSHGSWKWKKGFPEYLKPSDEMMANSDLANSFGTTLWFTEEDKTNGIPEALFISGQYTICMNLLEYIEKIKQNNDNTTTFHVRLITLEKTLKSDWDAFQKNPKALMI